jgi:hypothetical protein
VAGAAGDYGDGVLGVSWDGPGVHGRALNLGPGVLAESTGGSNLALRALGNVDLSNTGTNAVKLPLYVSSQTTTNPTPGESERACNSTFDFALTARCVVASGYLTVSGPTNQSKWRCVQSDTGSNPSILDLLCLKSM